jgi:hypothetical protein
MRAVTTWVLRVAWLGAGFALGPSVADALDGASAPVQWTAVIGLYAAWAASLLATLVPRSIGLTIVRIGGPAAVAVAVWAALAGGPAAVTDVVALAWAAVVAGVSLAGVTTDTMVDGSSYGSERRFALRVPLALLLGPVELAWVAVVAGAATGPLLLAAGSWIAGVVAVAAGSMLAVVGARALHQLSRRWLVFVPAGLVVHDPLAAAEPTLLARQVVAGLGPVLAGGGDGGESATLDLSRSAPGLVLEIRLRRPVPMGRVAAERVRFTPVRAGAVLAESARRGLARVPT